MPVSNPCSVMIGRVLSKDLGERRATVFLYTGTPRKEARTHVGGQSTEEVLGRQILSMTATRESLTPDRVSECRLLYFPMLVGERETPSSGMGRS